MILHIICHQGYANENNMPLHTVINRMAKIQNNGNIKRIVKGSVVTRSCGGERVVACASFLMGGTGCGENGSCSGGQGHTQ